MFVLLSSAERKILVLLVGRPICMDTHKEIDFK
jgi:hypothetical protein